MLDGGEVSVVSDRQLRRWKWVWSVALGEDFDGAEREKEEVGGEVFTGAEGHWIPEDWEAQTHRQEQVSRQRISTFREGPKTTHARTPYFDPLPYPIDPNGQFSSRVRGHLARTSRSPERGRSQVRLRLLDW